jgi:hypothetical protein
MDKKFTNCLSEIFLPSNAWAKEIAEFTNKKYKIQVSVYTDFFGELGTKHWFCDYVDLATMERVVSQIEADQEFWQKAIPAVDFFIQGSMYETIMRAI